MEKIEKLLSQLIIQEARAEAARIVFYEAIRAKAKIKKKINELEKDLD